MKGGVAVLALAVCLARPASADPAAAFKCGPRDAEWETWFHGVFGSGPELYHDGPDPSRLRGLAGKERVRAVKMLRRGLAACEFFAAEVVEGAELRELVPDLRRAVAAEDAFFKAHAVVALGRLGSGEDVSPELVAAMRSASEQARMTAAMGARLFPLEKMRAPLLERVRTDPSWLVRQHAAESLLDLADLHPRGIHAHPEIAKALFGDQLARAAELLDAAITKRLADGRCSKPTPFPGVSLHFVSMSGHAVALSVEDSVGPCERTLSFVVVVSAPAGFDGPPGFGMVGKERLATSLATLPHPVPVEYARATRKLVVGSVVLDTTKANVALVEVGPKGATSKLQSTQSLKFERRGRPTDDPLERVGLSPEVPPLVRAVLDRTPELAALGRQ